MKYVVAKESINFEKFGDNIKLCHTSVESPEGVSLGPGLLLGDLPPAAHLHQVQLGAHQDHRGRHHARTLPDTCSCCNHTMLPVLCHLASWTQVSTMSQLGRDSREKATTTPTLLR